MEQSTQEGGQTFDQALFKLYTEGRITDEQALANADSANNLRIQIKNLDLAGKTARQQRIGGRAGLARTSASRASRPTPHRCGAL